MNHTGDATQRHSRTEALYPIPIVNSSPSSSSLGSKYTQLVDTVDSCLDNSAQKSNQTTRTQKSKVSTRLSIYHSGELAIETVSRTSRPLAKPPVNLGKRTSKGVSRKAARLIRRTLQGRCALAKRRGEVLKPVLVTLTTGQTITDKEMRKYLKSWLSSARKYASDSICEYIIVSELQQRGALHFHILIFDEIPPSAYKRLRNLWADRYGHGSVSFDTKRLKLTKALPNYLGKAAGYLAKRGRYIGRNGKEYVRDVFEGNAYSISDELRKAALPVAEWEVSVSHPQISPVRDSASYFNDWAAYYYFGDLAAALTFLGDFGLSPPSDSYRVEGIKA